MALPIELLKNVLIISNVFVGSIGFLAIVVGGFFQHNSQYVLKMMNDEGDMYATSMAFIIIGFLVLVVTSFGWIAAINDSGRALIVYSIILGMIVIAEMVIGWISLTRITAIQVMLDRNLRQLWDNKEHHVAFWNTLQVMWSCCGIYSKDDWEHTPFSCCDPIRSLFYFCFARLNAYETPCMQAMHEFVAKYGRLFGLLAFGLAAVQLLGIGLACWLAVKLLAMRKFHK